MSESIIHPTSSELTNLNEAQVAVTLNNSESQESKTVMASECLFDVMVILA